ncbi:MAG: Gmad2 immunoglobulin-like domain-containing protein, partial [Acidimicrobiales bacterium]
TTPPTTINPVDYETAVWPWFDSTTRYDVPVAAAAGFAGRFIGCEDPIIGPVRQGDGRSGEVEVRPAAGGPITTVFVRQLGADDTWWVLGAVTANIVIAEPEALAEIDSPLEVSGQAQAFEGVVGLQLRADGSNTPLIDGAVIGGGTELRPFDGEFTWTNPGSGFGALVLTTENMDDGRVWEASVIRVAFAG